MVGESVEEVFDIRGDDGEGGEGRRERRGFGRGREKLPWVVATAFGLATLGMIYANSLSVKDADMWRERAEAYATLVAGESAVADKYQALTSEMATRISGQATVISGQGQLIELLEDMNETRGEMLGQGGVTPTPEP